MKKRKKRKEKKRRHEPAALRRLGALVEKGTMLLLLYCWAET